MARRSHLRASDTDRESVAERLRTAAAEGRLLTEELEERLTAALSAKTYGELDAVTADLPRESRDPVVRRGRTLPRIGPGPAVALVLLAPTLLAIMIAVVAIVFAMLTAWTVLAAVLWFVIGHRRHWYGPRWSYARRGPYARHGALGPPRPRLWL